MKIFTCKKLLIKKHYLIFSAFLLLMSSCNLSKNDEVISVGVVTTGGNKNIREIESVAVFLDKTSGIYYKLISPEHVRDSSLDDYDIIWFQSVDRIAPSSIFNQEKMIQKLYDYTANGGNLLLTMKALEMLPMLKLEQKHPETKVVNAKDHGYGRKRGYHAYLKHPIFKNMHGGAYVINPRSDTTLTQTGYFDTTYNPNGKTVAVDWAYIHLHENKKLILEYKIGKGKIMAIGAYVLFSMPNYHQIQLENFIKNVFNYMLNQGVEEKYYWDYRDNTLQEFDAALKKIDLWLPEDYKTTNNSLSFTFKPSDSFWDVAGERIVLMGKENGGIEEIWAHPFMALRDYEIGCRFPENDSIYWLNKNASQITISPSAIIRKYLIRNNVLTEYIMADIREPVALIHYTYSGEDIDLFVSFSTHLRLMWPYSSKVTGKINYSWSEQMNAFVFSDRTGNMVTLAGASKKPTSQLCGQFKNFTIGKTEIVGNETKEFKASALMQFSLKNKEKLEVLIAASNQGMQKTEKTYRQFANNTSLISKNAKQYYDSLLSNRLTFQTPDKDFDEAYKWALIGSDRFFVHTPGIGKSLVAGYATTAKGWDGNHKINGRPGYAWYFGRDGQWSGFALDNYGDFEKVREILKQYIRFQYYNGKIYHELTTSGVVHYDAADATPLFVILAGHYLKHSGDKCFIRENWESIQKAIDFCYSTDTDNNLLIENTLVGHGWVEGGHLFGGKTTLYLASCWAAALKEAANMAEVIGKDSLAITYKNDAEQVVLIINELFWNENLQHLNHSLNFDGTFIEDLTIMPAIPLYFKQVQDVLQKKMFSRFAGNDFSSDWGVRITSMSSERFNPRGYHTGSVWPLYTGWVALAEYKNKRPLNGFIHSRNNLMVYKHWSKGFIEEVLHGLEYKPSGVCAHQCWSETMAIQPLIEGMLGYEPRAGKNYMKLSPAFPVNWDSVKIQNIRMGNHKVSLKMERNDEYSLFTFSKNDNNKNLEVDFHPVFETGTKVMDVTLDEKEVDYQTLVNNNFTQLNISFMLEKEKKIRIKYKRGIGIIPPEYNPQPGNTSKELRIISSELNNGVYEILLQAPSGSVKFLEIKPFHYKIDKIIGGKIVPGENNKLKIEVTYNQSEKNQYVYKKLQIKLK